MLPRTLFSEEHELYRDQVRRFIEREITPHHAKWEKDKVVPRSVWRAAGEAGLSALRFPTSMAAAAATGFIRRSSLKNLRALGRLGRASRCTPISLRPTSSPMAPKSRRRRYLPPMAKGEIIGAIAMSEPGAGSDLQGVRTTAIKRGNGYVLNGSKTFITNGQNADVVIVVAKTDPAARRERHHAVSCR